LEGSGRPREILYELRVGGARLGGLAQAHPHLAKLEHGVLHHVTGRVALHHQLQEDGGTRHLSPAKLAQCGVVQRVVRLGVLGVGVREALQPLDGTKDVAGAQCLERSLVLLVRKIWRRGRSRLGEPLWAAPGSITWGAPVIDICMRLGYPCRRDLKLRLTRSECLLRNALYLHLLQTFVGLWTVTEGRSDARNRVELNGER